MILQRLFTVLVSMLAAASILNAQDTASSKDALQGTWQGEETGKEEAGKWQLIVTGDKIRMEGPGKVEWYEATFTVAEDQNPKQLQATITNCPKADFIGKAGISIFKIEGTTLTLAGNRPGVLDAPKDFNGSSRQFVFRKDAAGK